MLLAELPISAFTIILIGVLFLAFGAAFGAAVHQVQAAVRRHGVHVDPCRDRHVPGTLQTGGRAAVDVVVVATLPPASMAHRQVHRGKGGRNDVAHIRNYSQRPPGRLRRQNSV